MAKEKISQRGPTLISSKRNTSAASKKPVGIRKKPSTKFGRKIVRIEVGAFGEEPTEFTVHEDLLCLASPYFRAALQPKRRALEEDPDAECGICQDPLEPGVNDLTHCAATCGKNFHYDCIQAWKANKPGQGALTCPNCRQGWVAESNKIKTRAFHELDKVGYSIYQEWLYRGHVCIPDDVPEDESHNVNSSYGSLIKAYLVGVRVKDAKFATAVVETFLDVIKESGIYPGPGYIQYAYDRASPTSILRRFLIQIYLKFGHAEWFDESDPRFHRFPAEFMSNLVQEIFTHGFECNKDWDVEELKKELCQVGKDCTGELEEPEELSDIDEEYL